MTSRYKIASSPISHVEEAAPNYYSPFQKAALARHGVSSFYVQDLISKFEFSKAELSTLIGISLKTMDRNLASDKLFMGLQAERLIKLGELFLHGVKVFGDQHKFLKWLSSDLAALNNTKPKSWLDTQQGIELIIDELTRIEHGIFA